jgi:zinc protease
VKRALFALVLAAACGSPQTSPQNPETPKGKANENSADAWRKEMPKPGNVAKLDYPVPETTKLANGLEIWVLKRPAKVSNVSVVVRHGASAVPEKKSGLAALTARMLTEGTRKRSAAQLAEAAESLGSSLGDDAGRDYMSVNLTTLTEDVPKAIELLGEVVQTPAFSPVEFSRVQKEWLDGLALERQSPNRLASLAGLRLLLGPVDGAPVGGSVPDMKKLAVADVIQFHKTCFVPPSAAVIVVGDVTLESVKQSVEKVFAAWKGKSPNEPAQKPEAKAPEKTRVVILDRPESVQTALFVAQPFPARAAPGYEVREVMDNAVGGLFTSRINKNLREEHAYTYGARSDAIATRSWGAFVVSTSVETNVTADALHELILELRRAKDPTLKRPFDDTEVARSKTDLTNRLGAHLEEVESVAGDLETGFTLGLGADYFARYAALNAKITTAEVQSEARERFLPDRLYVVVVGDEKAIKDGLAMRGFAVEAGAPALSE